MQAVSSTTQNFFVTGATGFVGTHLTRALIERNGSGSVIALVHPRRRASEAAAYSFLQQHKARIIECDLLELPRVRPAVPEFDVLVHLAASAEPENPRADFSVNDVGTRCLIEWLGSGLRGRRLVFTSTLACVDSASSSGFITETTPCTPRTPYGRTKLRGEEIIRAGRSEFGYDFTILRLCTIIGLGFREQGMFGLCQRLLERQALASRIMWPGKTSFLAMRDLVRLIQRIPTEAKAANETFVCSNGENPTFDIVLEWIARLHGIERRRVWFPRVLWPLLGRVAWSAAGSPLVPPRLRTTAWRAANIIRDGICADATKMNNLFGRDYQSVQEALRESYAS